MLYIGKIHCKKYDVLKYIITVSDWVIPLLKIWFKKQLSKSWIPFAQWFVQILSKIKIENLMSKEVFKGYDTSFKANIM